MFISEPSNPILVGYLDTDGVAEGVHVSGDYAYIADGHNGLVIVDITCPTNGLVIVDITCPTNPVQVGHLDTDEAEDVHVSGNYAYVADGRNGFVIVDVSNPKNPVLVSDMLWMYLLGISGM